MNQDELTPEQQAINEKLQAMLEKRRQEMGEQPEPKEQEQPKAEPQEQPPSEEEIFSQMEEMSPPEQEPGYHTSTEFERLGKLGYGTKEFQLAGNKIQMKTLRNTEMMDAAVRAAAHPEAVNGRTYMLYCLTQALLKVNGKPWFKRKALFGDEDDVMEEKFKALADLYEPVIDKLTNEYRTLVRETNQKAMFAEKKS